MADATPKRQVLIAERIALVAGTPQARHQALERQFERRCTAPDEWLEHAESLKAAAQMVSGNPAELLQRPPQYADNRLMQLAYVRSYMLLMGFAFENLFKAIGASRQLIHLQPPSKKGERRLAFKWTGGNSHSLALHAASLRVHLLPQESDLLRRIEAYSAWAGRYPFPLNLNDYERSQTEALLTWTTQDHDAADKLFDRLAGEVTIPPQTRERTP